LVIQAALFVGFLSAFLIELLSRLEPDPMDIIQDVLIYQTKMMRNSTLEPYILADFSPPEHIVVVNALFYASLGVMLLAAFIAMLIKSWVREFDRGLSAMSIPEQRAKTREFRYLGMKRWKLPEMAGILPLLIQISLALFALGLVLFLFHISTPSFGVTTAIFGVGVLYYAITTSISVFVTSSPFRSPLSRTFGKVYQYVHAYFCPPVNAFLSTTMDITRATALSRVRQDIQIILQKLRPYVEKYFEEPIAATTMDEVQLSTAASALQRIHDSAPNSQHSEALQGSVWQVAGSATLRIPPSFELPSWILDRAGDEEYFSHLPAAMSVALVSVWLRASGKMAAEHIAIAGGVLQRIDDPEVSWAQLVIAVFRRILPDSIRMPYYDGPMKPIAFDHLTNMIRRKEFQREECLWLLSTLSELHHEGLLPWQESFLIAICLAIFSDGAPEWRANPPDVALLEAVVTLTAIVCSPNRHNRRHILTSSREHPWLLLNIRNPALFDKWFEDTHFVHHKQLISLLFLILYALICRRSYPLAIQFFTTITAKGGLPLYASALTAIAPVIKDSGLSVIFWMIMAPETQEISSIIDQSMAWDGFTCPEELFKNYDLRLGASGNPDPNLFAILLILSKRASLHSLRLLWYLNPELENPWLRLAVRVVVGPDIPDGSGLPMEPFHDHRVHNMIAALSLLRYTRDVTQYTESQLLASFLNSRELAISSVALEYYMRTTISYSDPVAPSRYLSHAVYAVFNLMLPDDQLRIGWEILEMFVDGFEDLPVGWRRAFATSFFSLSYKPLPRPRRDMEPDTRESELEKILTWEYFHEEEQEPELTDSEFSGLDWLAMAWSLHLSQQSGKKTEGSGQREAQSWNSSGPAVDEEFVLRALCKLLDASPYYQIAPNLPKLLEFVHWFDYNELPEYRSMISARIERGHQESYKFHCSLPM
jgi:hypothetical protein